MTFHWPHLLWLILAPLAAALVELARRRQAGPRPYPKIQHAEASPHDLVLRAGPGATRGTARWRLWLGLTFAIVALARPQWGRIEEPVFEQAREILVALDLSRSMLAEDVRPSRLERAKLLITSLLERLEGERIGLIVFAGTSFLQSPLSSDYEILREFLPELGPDFLPAGGTNYEALLTTALDGFGASGAGADRFLIILSDGESQSDTWRDLLDRVRESDIRVIALGVGTPAGAMVPDGAGAFVKDQRGAVVLSRLEGETLQELARRTGGTYRDASAWIDLAELIESTVEQGRAGEFSETQRVRQVERFQWALAPGVLLLLWSFWREFPVHPRSRPMKPKPTATLAAAGLLLLAFGPPHPIAAQAPAPRDTSPLAAPLVHLVTRLATASQLNAPDYAELANTTLTYGRRLQSAQQPVSESTIRDGLAAVARGRALDPTAADWDQLQRDLESLLPEPPPDEQPPPEQPPPSGEPPDQNEQDPSSSDQNSAKGAGSPEQSQGDPQEADHRPDGERADGAANPSPPESKDGDGSPQDPRRNDQPGSPADDADSPARPPSPGQSAFGDLQEDGREAPPPSAPAPRPADQPTQRVGGQSRRQDGQRDPALAVPLQKLDQLRQEDSPAKLHQLMQDPQTSPADQGRDW